MKGSRIGGSGPFIGRRRRVVERTQAWLNRMRLTGATLEQRRSGRADLQQAFTNSGCALICLCRITRFRRAFLVSRT